MANNPTIKVPSFFKGPTVYPLAEVSLVDFSISNPAGTLFSLGGFSVSTNLDETTTVIPKTSNFSNFVTLSSMNLTLSQTIDLLESNSTPILNLDPSQLTNYALFGSLTKFIQNELEQIILNWPASLYCNSVVTNPILLGSGLSTGYTVSQYTYNQLNNISSFQVNTNIISNNFQINYLLNGTIQNSFSTSNTLRNLTVSYPNYSVLFNGNYYPILGFTGASSNINSFIYLTVQGNVFSGSPSNNSATYYIVPNQQQQDLFFNGLSPFSSYVLNRQTLPLYTSNFTFTEKANNGVLITSQQSLTWPVTNGYDIDFSTVAYTGFAGTLLMIAQDQDSTVSDLITRFLVPQSIISFDTPTNSTSPFFLDSEDEDTSGGKMNKLLKLYGRQFDDINNYISGIQFANTISYDKKNNTPDLYIKQLAKVLGWGTISSVLENDLLGNYVNTQSSSYSGQSVGLTLVQADTELFRRLILNSAWIWKSKGTRKTIEFLCSFLGIPSGLYSLNEYVYLADQAIDVNLFQEVLILNGLSDDISTYAIDPNGFPNPPSSTATNYFQNFGGWYRETIGPNSMLDVLTGNNPHQGNYDNGQSYLTQFTTLIPNFSAVTISGQTTILNTDNLFTNYNDGTLDFYSGTTYVDIETEDGVDLSNCYVVTPEFIPNPFPNPNINSCGCPNPTDQQALSICISGNTPNLNISTFNCNTDLISVSDGDNGYYTFSYKQYNPDGSLYVDRFNNPIPRYSVFANKTCCNMNGSQPFYYEITSGSGTTANPFIPFNSGYICCDTSGLCGCQIACDWTLNSTPTISLSGNTYLQFVTELGETRITTPDGCNCISPYSIPIQIVDPLTGILGYGCSLLSAGVSDLSGTNVQGQTYFQRQQGTISCTSIISG